MRVWISFLMAVVVLGWVALALVARQPRPAAPPGTSSPDPESWSFDRPVMQRESFEIAQARGQVHQDPARRKLRQAVLDASARLEYSPCDKQLRPPLRSAIAALLMKLRATFDQKIETATIDAEVLDATAFLNTAAAAVMSEARHVGLVYREDLPPEVGILFPPRPPYPDSGRYGGRFTCVDGRR
jgi:hypothetical protein